ncbi:IS1634 family transposase [Caldinitratiruptor microaerophilus]|uniref:IS1634 family transposase n=1 Tax=Caldinitratiruptor microaerophilus TaxID=671077 RepID=UPI00222E3F69|nr:IS1634 family transposase [Caldinitratiruptor microaerophilus]
MAPRDLPAELETGVPSLQHLYRTLDYLVEAKEQLEDHMYGQLRDLLNLRLNLVFYDVTSTYFEGDHCPLAEYGYSRDHRPDRKQITIGLLVLVSPEGLPIAHEVFRGGTVDYTTVPGVLERLQKRFGVQSCAFVSHRGTVTAENLRRLHEAGSPYVLGYHKRGRALSDQLLAEHTDLAAYTEGPDGLLYKETPLATDPEDGSPLPGTTRTLLCYNEAKAQEDRALREVALAEAEAALRDLQQRLATQDRRRGRKFTAKGVMLRVAEILGHKGVAKFFQVAYDGRELRFERDEAAIAKETLRDGKFLVQTSADLSPWDVIRAYKNLQRVETAFRELKDFLRIRPVYHWNEQRVRGHVFTCVLAYLFEQWMEVVYTRHVEARLAEAARTADPAAREEEVRRLQSSRLTGRRILDLLSRLHATAQTFVGKPFYAVTTPTPQVGHVLKVLDVPPPSAPSASSQLPLTPPPGSRAPRGPSTTTLGHSKFE